MFVGIPDTEVSVEDLIKGMIVLSGNDACIVVAEGIAGTEESFAERMNKKAKELGMTGTVFKNASGWPAEGQMTTARDLALLAWHTINDFPKYYHVLFDPATGPTTTSSRTTATGCSKITPGTDGLKTGHTEEGGFGQTTSAVRDGRRLILVVNGLASMARGRRAQETSRLMEWGFREFDQHHDLQGRRHGGRGAGVARRAGQGAAGRGALGAGHQRRPARPPQPRVVARFDGPLPAPIAKGTKLGTAAVTPARRPGDGVSARGRRRRAAPGAGRPHRRRLARHYLFGWLS